MTKAAQPRISPALTALVDVIMIVVFAFLARVAHNTEDMPLTVGGWLSTAWPFVLGVLLYWGLLWFGILGDRTGTEYSSATGVWLSTVVVGLVIWGLRNAAIPHWSFVIVAAVMSAVLLFGWRLIVRLASRK